jgi:hypothetical protein
MNPNYVDPSIVIQGSSSPTQPSSSDYEDDASREIDEDENEDRRAIPEDIAVRLATEFTRYVLQFCLVQDDDSVEIRPRVEHRRTKTTIANVDSKTYEDDGDLCTVERTHQGWIGTHPFLALFEGKRAFRHLLVDPRTGESSPIVSNHTLAQYLAEAIITWRQNKGLLRRESVPSLLHEFPVSPVPSD